MATRKTRGIDTSSLPSAQELIALSARPNATAEGLQAAQQGVLGGVDLATQLADRTVARQQKIAQIQETIRKAKEEALQSQREQRIGQEMSGTTPEATRVAARIGGQDILAKQTKSFADEGPARLKAAVAAAQPLETAKDMFKQEQEEAKSTRDFSEAQQLSKQKFEQDADLERLKASLKDKEGKKGLSAMLERQTFSLQKGVGLIQEIKNSVAQMPKTEGLVGAAGALKTRVQQAGRGFLGGNPETLSFEELRPTAGKALYKDISGDVGNISDSEGKMAANLVPSRYDSPGVRASKIARLERLQAQSKESIAKLSKLAITHGWDEKQYEEAVKSTIFSHIIEASVDTRPALESLVE